MDSRPGSSKQSRKPPSNAEFRQWKLPTQKLSFQNLSTKKQSTQQQKQQDSSQSTLLYHSPQTQPLVHRQSFDLSNRPPQTQPLPQPLLHQRYSSQQSDIPSSSQHQQYSSQQYDAPLSPQHQQYSSQQYDTPLSPQHQQYSSQQYDTPLSPQHQQYSTQQPDIRFSSQPQQYSTQQSDIRFSSQHQQQSDIPFSPQQQQPGFHSSHSTDANHPILEQLHAERSKLLRQIELNEARAIEAEKRYNDYAALPETEQQKALREYKQYAERKFGEDDKRVRELQRLGVSQEKQLADVSAEMELVLGELIKLKADRKKQRTQEKPETEIMHNILEYKTMYTVLQEQANEMKQKIKELEIACKNGLREPSAEEVISSLESIQKFIEDGTGLKFIDSESKDGLLKCIYHQVGELGSVKYQLEFYRDTELVVYTPLDVDVVDQQAADPMNMKLEFHVTELVIFLWRQMTYLNLKKRL